MIKAFGRYRHLDLGHYTVLRTLTYPRIMFLSKNKRNAKYDIIVTDRCCTRYIILTDKHNWQSMAQLLILLLHTVIMKFYAIAKSSIKSSGIQAQDATFKHLSFSFIPIWYIRTHMEASPSCSTNQLSNNIWLQFLKVM